MVSPPSATLGLGATSIATYSEKVSSAELVVVVWGPLGPSKITSATIFQELVNRLALFEASNTKLRFSATAGFKRLPGTKLISPDSSIMIFVPSVISVKVIFNLALSTTVPSLITVAFQV